MTMTVQLITKQFIVQKCEMTYRSDTACIV